MSKYSNLGKSIADARKRSGLTQTKLSEKAGVSYSTLAKMERGAIESPSVFTIADIAEVLGISIDEIVKGASSAHVIDSSRENFEEVKFVYSDVNGVLVRFFQRIFRQVAIETGVSTDRIETAFWHYNDAVNRGSMTTDEFNQAVETRLGIEPGSLDWENRYMSTVEPITAMHKCLGDIAKTVKIGLLSDSFPGFLNSMIKKGLLPDLKYSAIVESASVGAKKPDQKIYEIAEKKAGVPGRNIFFVDDSRTNLIAAEHRGWRVLWFDDYQPDESVRRVQEAVNSRVSLSALEQSIRKRK